MFSGFYTAASGMLVQQRTINVLGNNLTNQKTPGYQAERVLSTTFDYEYTMRRDAYGKQKIGASSPIRIVNEVPTRFVNSHVEDTGRSFDLGLTGSGFFNIEGEEGQVLLTRNGSFDIDEQGYLVMRGVGRVLGQDGPLAVESADFTVSEDGIVTSGAGDQLGALLITAPDSGQMKKLTNGLYTVENAEQNLPSTSIGVYQGGLETSNIDYNREMTQMMEANRSFQACGSAMKILDEMNQRSTQIAKL